MNGVRTTIVRWSDEYQHSTDQVEYEVLKELQKRDKRYKKGLERSRSKEKSKRTSPLFISDQTIVKSDVPSSGAPLSFTNRPTSSSLHPNALLFVLKSNKTIAFSLFWAESRSFHQTRNHQHHFCS